MARAIAKILTAGRFQILQAAAGLGSFVPHGFAVGSTAAFQPLAEELMPRGDRVYEGSAQAMEVVVQTTNTVRYSATLPEGSGPFDVGNAIFYVATTEGTVVPFASIVLPFPVRKEIATYAVGDSTYPLPGNRFQLSITINHDLVDSDADGAVLVEVLTPDFANLAWFESDLRVPAPDLNPYAQFVVRSHALSGTPTLVTKSDDGLYYASPFVKDLRHPKFNVVDGGISGDAYREPNLTFLWGHTFDTPDADYTGVIGGADFDMPDGPALVIGSTF